MDRTKFYVVKTHNSIDELDFLENSLSGFRINYPVSYHRVDATDLLRPDMISYKAYGTVSFWWLVCYINDIWDIFSDLELGQVLRIPNILDIYDFYKKYKAQ